MCFTNLSSESRVIRSHFYSTLEVSRTSLIVTFIAVSLLRKIWDFPVLAFISLFWNHLNNLKASDCNSNITARSILRLLKLLLIFTPWVLFVKYEWIKLRPEDETPHQKSLAIKSLWPIQSNALERLVNNAPSSFLLSA